MAVSLIPERSFRGPGCTDACEVVKAIVPGRVGRSEFLLHDPTAHEEYGRVTAGPMGQAVVWTGPLIVDRWARKATLNGIDLRLSRREWGILDYLAGHLNRACTHREILGAAWGPEWLQESHLLRITVARLRGRLQEASNDEQGLIRTMPGIGYALAALPPVETDPSRHLRRAVRRWALAWSWCICCGSATLPHFGHGRCTQCRTRLGRWQHFGPCGAPPA